MTGKVYFVSAPGRIKIGYTLQPERRLKTLRDVDMEQLTMISTIDGNRKLEKKLHALAARYRLRGEWFEDRPEVRAIIDGAMSGEICAADDDVIAADVCKDESERVQIANPHLMRVCKKLSADLDASIQRRDDKYDIRAHANALIAVTEQMLGQSLVSGRNRT